MPPNASPSGFAHRAMRARPIRMILARPRFYICVVAAALGYFVTPIDWRNATRLLAAWNLGAVLFIALVLTMTARANSKTMRRRAAIEDESRWVLLAFGVLAAAAALGAIVAELGAVKDMAGLSKALHIALTIVTILSGWTFIHLLFALHYAHEYYAPTRDTDDPPEAARTGLRFPCDGPPTYGDFLYYSFVIGCACATADVETISKVMRRTTLLHGVVSFFFNTVILALTINIAAGYV
jgi:uncharacterized membrane protein